MEYQNHWGVQTPEGTVVFTGPSAYQEALAFFLAHRDSWPEELKSKFWPCINIKAE